MTYNLKSIGDLPEKYKEIINYINEVNFIENYDEIVNSEFLNETKKKIYHEESPIKSITKDQWNKILTISSKNENFLQYYIDLFLKFPEFFNKLFSVEKDLIKENWLSNNLDYNYLSKIAVNEIDIDIFYNPFNIFVLYSIISPTQADKFIPLIINFSLLEKKRSRFK